MHREPSQTGITARHIQNKCWYTTVGRN